MKKFESWPEVLAYAKTGAPLYYQAPMDHHATRLTPAGATPYPYTYRAGARTIRIWPPGSIGRGRSRTADPFNADAKHLERFSRAEETRGVGEKMHASHRNPADKQAATELVMFIENESDLSPDGPKGQGRSVLLNALRKWKKGTYDPALAVRLFEHLVESGAKRYAKEFGSSEKEWSTMFTPATRQEAAKQLEASFRSSAEGGEYDHVDVRTGAGEEMHARGAPQRQQRAGSFVVTLSTGQTARFHDMPRAREWAEQRLTGQPAGTYAAFYRAAVGPDRSDAGAPWTEPFYLLTVDEYGHVRVGDARIVAPLPAQHPHRSLSERHEITGPATDGIYHYRGASIELSSVGTRKWWATLRFRSQEIDFEATSSEEALEKAKDYVDSAPEMNKGDTPDDYGRPYPREHVEASRRSSRAKYRPSKDWRLLKVDRVVPSHNGHRVEFVDGLTIQVHSGSGRSDLLYAMKPTDTRYEGRSPGPERRREYQWVALKEVLGDRQADFHIDHDGDVVATLRN